MSEDLKRYQREDAGNKSQTYNFLTGLIGPTRERVKKRAGDIVPGYLGRVRKDRGGVPYERLSGEISGGGENTEGGPNSQMISQKLGPDGAGFIADAYREFMRAGNSGSMGRDFDEWLLEYAVQRGVL